LKGGGVGVAFEDDRDGRLEGCDIRGGTTGVQDGCVDPVGSEEEKKGDEGEEELHIVNV
jgi:hypothetical protein